MTGVFHVFYYYFAFLAWIVTSNALRHVDRIELPTSSIGTRRHLLVYSYASAAPMTKRAYVQASLHADELPGMLVINHLLKVRVDPPG